tara:strand:- start:446 stop:649 length:204 start_codon:yes stop_codon:yes gene_type:complete
MTPMDVEQLANELHFEIFYDDTGQMILLTGIVDEAKRTAGLGEDGEEQMEMFDDDEEWVEDDYDDDY